MTILQRLPGLGVGTAAPPWAKRLGCRIAGFEPERRQSCARSRVHCACSLAAAVMAGFVGCAAPQYQCRSVSGASVVTAPVRDDLVDESHVDLNRDFTAHPEQMDRFWVRARGFGQDRARCVAIDASWSSRPAGAVFSFSAVAEGGVSVVHRLFVSVEAPPAPRCRPWPRSPRWWFRATSWVRSTAAPDTQQELWSVGSAEMLDVQRDSDQHASALTMIGPRAFHFSPPVELRSSRWIADFGQWFYTRDACEVVCQTEPAVSAAPRAGALAGPEAARVGRRVR